MCIRDRVQGGPGAITNRRGMKKYPGGLIFVRFGWSYEGFMPILIFDESLGYACFLDFKQFSIKSAFEPITPSLKWVLADAACKFSMIFLNIASIRAGRCKMVIFADFVPTTPTRGSTCD